MPKEPTSRRNGASSVVLPNTSSGHSNGSGIHFGEILSRNGSFTYADCCVVSGNDNKIFGHNNTIIGNRNEIFGDNNSIEGDNLKVVGNHSSINGDNLNVVGDYNGVKGNDVEVVGDFNSVEGDRAHVKGDCNYAVGSFITMSGSSNEKTLKPYTFMTIQDRSTRTHATTVVEFNNRIPINVQRNVQISHRTARASPIQPQSSRKPKHLDKSDFVGHVDSVADADRLTCTICNENSVCCCLEPCKHASFCYSCISTWTDSHCNCPTCRNKITKLTRFKL